MIKRNRLLVALCVTAIGAARIWIGLKNSDDAGLRVDLQGRVLVNGVAAASGVLSNDLAMQVALGRTGVRPNPLADLTPLTPRRDRRHLCRRRADLGLADPHSAARRR